MKHYIVVEDGIIQGGGACPCTNENAINIDVDEELYEDIMLDREQNIDNPIKYIYSNGEIIKNPEWERIVLERQKQEQKKRLLSEIDELDIKRIRAICEPSIKDETTGETWLEYYSLQILNLRQQIKDLEV